MSHRSTVAEPGLCPALATSAPKGSGQILWSWGLRQDIARLMKQGENVGGAVDMAIAGRLEVQRRRNAHAETV